MSRIQRQTITLTFHCGCTEALWVDWKCSSPTAAAGVCAQTGRSAPLSSPPALARGHGPIAIVGWLHGSKPRSRVQPPPLFAPPLSVVDVSSPPILTVTQHFSVRIAREGPAVSVNTSSSSALFASGLAHQARHGLRCRNRSLAPTDLFSSPRRPVPRFLSHQLWKSTPIPNSK